MTWRVEDLPQRHAAAPAFPPLIATFPASTATDIPTDAQATLYLCTEARHEGVTIAMTKELRKNLESLLGEIRYDII